MQGNSSNGTQVSATVILDSLRQSIEKLDADLQAQRQEIVTLRTERDDYRRMLVEYVKPQLLSREEWEKIDEREFTLTIDDILAVLDEK